MTDIKKMNNPIKIRNKSKWLVPDTPECEVDCGVCGKPIVFAMFSDSALTIKHRVPAAHHGACMLIYQRQQTIENLNRINKKRGKK